MLGPQFVTSTLDSYLAGHGDLVSRLMIRISRVHICVL